LAYYEILFEDKYDVTAAAAYYPREDELLVQPPGDYRDEVFWAARDMVDACANYTGDTTFEANSGPLCGWSPDDRSPFYGVCSECTWNVPVDNRETLEQMVDEGYRDGEIADDLGTTANAVGYWRRKLDL